MAKEIKNYLKSVKDITAPLNWKSAPDSPPTQLAYITQPEIDMLVQANIHGSMKGKPNKGPKGIISLDGGDSLEDIGYTKKEAEKYTSSTPTIDVSTQEGQDKRQEFRDKTGSNVVTDAEKEGRKALGRDPADTSAPDGGKPPTKKEEEEEEEKQNAFNYVETVLERLRGKDLTKKISPQELALYRALVANQQDNMPDYNILEAFVKNLSAVGEQVNPLTRYLGLAGDGEELFRDDADDGAGGTNTGLNIAKLRELERAISGDEQIGQFYGELVDGGVSVNLPGSLTLEGRTKFIDDMLGSEFEERLKRQNPEIYYPDNYMPATSGGLADLGGQAAINITGMDRESDEYKQAVKYNNMIFSARSELDRMGKDMFGNKNMPTQTSGGGFVPPATTPDDPMIPQDPTLPPGVTPPATTPKFPGSVVTDYTQLGLPNIYGNQQMPNYATFNRAGSMPVGLQDYLDNLRKRFGIG